MGKELDLLLKIDEIKAAINRYYLALDKHEHGGVAQDKAFKEIEKILGKSWERGLMLEVEKGFSKKGKPITYEELMKS